MTLLDDFTQLIDGIRGHLTQESGNIEEFLQFYEEAQLFMELRKILPDNEFTKKRLAFIGRDLALTIYFAMHDMCEEAQILLRQILDFVYIILYGANHVLELELIEAGRMELIGNIRAEIERLFPLRGQLQRLYRKLSCVVHGTVNDLLSQVATVAESWASPSKLGHWKHDFHLTLEYAACLCRNWLPKNYAKLDVSVRANLETRFPCLKIFGKAVSIVS